MGIQVTQEIRAKQGNVTNINVGVVAVLVSAKNPKRSSLEVLNMASHNIYFGYDDTVTVNNGFPIFPNGYKSWVKTGLDVYLIAGVDSDVRYAVEFDGLL